jgi:hypothetical protein
VWKPSNRVEDKNQQISTKTNFSLMHCFVVGRELAPAAEKWYIFWVSRRKTICYRIQRCQFVSQIDRREQAPALRYHRKMHDKPHFIIHSAQKKTGPEGPAFVHLKITPEQR